MKVKRIVCILILGLSVGCEMLQAAQPPVTFFFKALQMNIWMGGSKVEGAVGMIADEIIRSDADVVFLNELRDYQGEHFVLYMTKELQRRGYVFYGESSSLSVGMLSRFPIESQEVVFPCTQGDKGAILRATFSVEGRKVAAYAAHLDYRHYACYLPRGYNGTTWKRMDAPVVDELKIMEMSRKSDREEAIGAFLMRVQTDIEQNYTILLAGDFNEPSHLDWQDDTKNLWGHNGVTVRWDCSSMLYEKGFKDAYRTLYSSSVTHPGFTFPAGNKAISADKLTWAPEADERERIDFIYYYPSAWVTPKKAWVVGPSESVVKGETEKERTKDCFSQPKGGWPTDHKSVMVLFRIK